MNKEEKKCLLYGEECKLENHKTCSEEYQKYAKILFCKDSGCIYNKDLDQGKRIKRGGMTVDGGYYSEFETPYKGICIRPEIGFTTKENGDVICNFRSDKKCGKGVNLDRFLDHNGQPFGGNLSPASDVGLSDLYPRPNVEEKLKPIV